MSYMLEKRSLQLFSYITLFDTRNGKRTTKKNTVLLRTKTTVKFDMAIRSLIRTRSVG